MFGQRRGLGYTDLVLWFLEDENLVVPRLWVAERLGAIARDSRCEVKGPPGTAPFHLLNRLRYARNWLFGIGKLELLNVRGPLQCASEQKYAFRSRSALSFTETTAWNRRQFRSKRLRPS